MFGIVKKKIMDDEVLHTIDLIVTAVDIVGKSVLEVGSRNVNGSARTIIEKYDPIEYIGIDIQEGNGVDQICNVYDLVSVFGRDRFDVVVCTETLEHIENWISAITNLKGVLKSGGLMFLSAPVPGRKYHGYPFDFWRYTEEDWKVIFTDMIIWSMQRGKKGIVLRVEKPLDFEESKLQNIELYSIVKRKRILC